MEYADYAYFLWESASSTLECPKFRVILPLDKRVEWVNEPEKLTKKAILAVFSKWHDNKASWYFSPTTSKVETFIDHNGIPYPSSAIEDRIMVGRMFAQMESNEREQNARRANLRRNGHNPEGWRNFKTVKECLVHSLPPHERHDPLFKACSAMTLNGYKDAIPQFLSEVDCPQNHKREMLRQFK